MRKGVFYEIGGAGALSHVLVQPDWKERTNGAWSKEQPFPIPEHYKNEYDSWECVVVEPSPQNMIEVINYHKHLPIEWVTCAVGSENKFLEKMSVLDLTTSPWIDNPNVCKTDVQTEEAHNSLDLSSDTVYSIWTATLTLDTLIRYVGKIPTVLRIDIEGAEVVTLENYSFYPKPRMIQVDHHTMNLDAVLSILRSHDYHILETHSNIGGDANDIVAEYHA